ncbi:MAG: ATP-binding protein [Chlorobi bacterium]|nr:ATP-binding protein [Chlorobiota bacterium]
MTSKNILTLIEKGENQNIEFKQRFSSFHKIAKEFIAFANTNGGIVLFGIDDDGSVHGVESEKGEAELIKEAAEQYCQPPVKYNIDFVPLYGKEIVVVTIEESEFKPHRIQDYKNEIDINSAEVYVRVNDKSMPASKEMIKILQAIYTNKKLINYSIGKTEEKVFELLADHENTTVSELAQSANISNRRASRTLIKMVRANLLVIHTKDSGESYFTSR